MLFLSFEYLFFLAVLLTVYWALPAGRRNPVLLLANLTFFSYWDWRSVLIVLLSGSAEWWLAGRLLRAKSKRLWLGASLLLNICVWLGFKYFGFFIDSIPAPVTAELRAELLQWAVPLGISFWMLQKWTYTFDIYFEVRREAVSWLDFMAFVSFFPTALSGPIERSGSLLVQLSAARYWQPRWLREGVWLVFLGLFKKAFIAGRCRQLGESLDQIQPNGLLAYIGVLIYTIELYADFSGYSDMARGSARLLGLDIRQNFMAPFFSRNLSEYWQRWHASLYDWLNAYVFIPASMLLRRQGTPGLLIAIWATFLLSGVWHGFGWTFLVWGAIHALGISVYNLTGSPRKKLRKRFPDRLWLSVGATLLTFFYITVANLFFEAPDLAAALSTIRKIFTGPLFAGNWVPFARAWVFYALIVFAIHALEKREDDPFWIFGLSGPARGLIYFCMTFALLRFHAPATRFIYQQF